MHSRTSSQGPRTCRAGPADAGSLQPVLLCNASPRQLAMQGVQEAEAEAARRAAAEEAASRAADAEAAREAALGAQLEEARAGLAALQRQAEAGQRAMLSLQAASEAESAGLQVHPCSSLMTCVPALA